MMEDTKETRVNLTEDDLSAVTGGITVDIIIKKIKELYAWVPKDILDRIIDSISTQGYKAARALVERIAKTMPNIKGIADLLPRQ